MKPCIVCGKMIKKTESVMSVLYVCSSECKSIRKQSLPKRISNTSWQYWTTRGFTELEAKNKVSELQSQLSNRNVEKYSTGDRQIRSPFCKQYWMKLGYLEEESLQQLAKTAEEIWTSDKIKQTCLLTERNIHTIVVWESSDTAQMLTMIMEKINEFRKS